MRGGEESDEVLLARAGRGDRLAASALVLRHTDPIFAACWRMLGDRAAAEDAAQETFLKLWTHASRWRTGDAALKTWLYKVAMNACIDRLRKRRRDAPEEEAQRLADQAPAADERLIAAERTNALAAALAALPDRQRLAITLCHYEELSNIEAAAAMAASVEAVESLLARGRRSLRATLGDRPPQQEGARHDESGA